MAKSRSESTRPPRRASWNSSTPPPTPAGASPVRAVNSSSKRCVPIAGWGAERAASWPTGPPEAVLYTVCSTTRWPRSCSSTTSGARWTARTESSPTGGPTSSGSGSHPPRSGASWLLRGSICTHPHVRGRRSGSPSPSGSSTGPTSCGSTTRHTSPRPSPPSP